MIIWLSVPSGAASASGTAVNSDVHAIAATWNGRQWDRGGVEVMEYKIWIDEDMYFHARRSNIPAGTPHVNDILDTDVETWAYVKFYTNPIFIEGTFGLPLSWDKPCSILLCDDGQAAQNAFSCDLRCPCTAFDPRGRPNGAGQLTRSSARIRPRS